MPSSTPGLHVQKLPDASCPETRRASGTCSQGRCRPLLAQSRKCSQVQDADLRLTLTPSLQVPGTPASPLPGGVSLSFLGFPSLPGPLAPGLNLKMFSPGVQKEGGKEKWETVAQGSQLTASPLQARFQDHRQRPGTVGCSQPLYFIRS